MISVLQDGEEEPPGEFQDIAQHKILEVAGQYFVLWFQPTGQYPVRS